MARIEVDDVSGSVPTIGATTRYNRDPGGRFAPRKPSRVGPLGPAGGIGPGGVDAVTGKWIPGRNHARLVSDPRNFERVVHRVTPDHGYNVAPERKCPCRVQAGELVINHILSCPACAIGG